MLVSCMADADRLSGLQHISAASLCSKILKQCMSADKRVPLFPLTELKYFGDGATVVISLDGLNWLSKRTCSDKGTKKRYHF